MPPRPRTPLLNREKTRLSCQGIKGYGRIRSGFCCLCLPSGSQRCQSVRTSFATGQIKRRSTVSIVHPAAGIARCYAGRPVVCVCSQRTCPHHLDNLLLVQFAKVLQWIHSKSCKYHAFVAHRTTTILDTSSAAQWWHKPGELNPANDGSRVSAPFITSHHHWFRGPDFLLLPEES